MTDTLYAAPTGGSMLIEAAYALAGEPLATIDLAWEDDWETSPLAAVNPLLQVPTLVLAGGQILTESAAILLYLAERFPMAHLAPEPGDPQRAEFLRWLTFYPAAIYPTFTFADIPTRFVEGDEAAGAKLARACLERRQFLYRQMEAACGQPFFLGARFCAIDLFVWAATHWTPRRAWFIEHAPKLAQIGERLDAMPELAAVNARNPHAAG